MCVCVCVHIRLRLDFGSMEILFLPSSYREIDTYTDIDTLNQAIPKKRRVENSEMKPRNDVQ